VKLTASGVWAVHNDGINNRQLLTNGDNPVWVDEDHLIVQIAANSNSDLYLLTISATVTNTLTTDPGMDTEPAYVKAIGPAVMIKSPTNPWSCTTAMASGFVASVGVPDVKLNGISATIQGDEWSVPLNLSAGIHTLTVTVTDSATGMSSQDQITTHFEKCVFLPLILKSR
jgi:uncharacterized Zn-binding protein involved in type VI secretion